MNRCFACLWWVDHFDLLILSAARLLKKCELPWSEPHRLLYSGLWCFALFRKPFSGTAITYTYIEERPLTKMCFNLQ